MDRAECLLSLLKSMRVPQAPRGTMLRETRFFSTRFFEDVRSDRVRLCDFREMQKRFFFAVVYVTRPMAVLVSRIDEQSKRMLVLENIVEEHGHGCYEKSHESTFLASIGCRLDIAEPPEVRAFNIGLMGVCLRRRADSGGVSWHSRVCIQHHLADHRKPCVQDGLGRARHAPPLLRPLCP